MGPFIRADFGLGNGIQPRGVPVGEAKLTGTEFPALLEFPQGVTGDDFQFPEEIVRAFGFQWDA